MVAHHWAADAHRAPETVPKPDTEPRSAPWLCDAVHSHLDQYLTRRLAEARESGAHFTTEVAERVAGFVLGGGKRVRPTFAWWGWRATGGPGQGPLSETALRTASALELLHACALIQDDMMDGARVRRGEPATRVLFARDHRQGGWSGDPDRYGDCAAVLAGDLALVWAEDMFEYALRDRSEARGRVYEPWRAMRTEMIAGQFLDVRAQARGDEDEATAMHVNRLKTATYSVERPLHLGAAMADASDATVACLRAYGSVVGAAYQLRDDLLDLYGEPALTGKAAGGDLREGKRTVVLAVGLRRAHERGDARAIEALRSAPGTPELTADDVRTVADHLDALGARASVEEWARALVDTGVRSLQEAPLEPGPRVALTQLAHEAVRRLG